MAALIDTALIRAFVTVRVPVTTGMTLHSVTTIGLGCRTLRKPDQTSRAIENPT
ncbi:hypothetical protein EV385_2031 [Krasilnikovia cinnamomea]|uniref:Uncharacterized protein n=1 Tax=Krasilnikovia cinnamomea TaxID=349313 RepID=A0A4Q7ZIH3_9ACTN|nr:hypothetical protein EV385_2031 [Krasilnikovia cinnamomea]